MKKFLTAILLGLISVISVFSFAACGGGQEGAGTTVTEAKWKTAFSYFAVNWNDNTYTPQPSDYPRTDFSCKMVLSTSYDGEQHSTEVTSSCDYTNLASECEIANDDGTPEALYGWKEGDVFYGTGSGWRLDGETGKRIYFYTKQIIDDEESFLLTFDSGIYSYAGGEYIWALNLADKFGQFEYSEENAEYTATLYYGFYEADALVTVKFKNDMLAYMSVSIGENKYGAPTYYTFTYTYGTTVTVPEFFLNLQLGETVKQ